MKIGKWTKTETNELEKYLVQNKTLAEISILLNREVHSVTKKTMALGYRRIWTKLETSNSDSKRTKISIHNDKIKKCFQ